MDKDTKTNRPGPSPPEINLSDKEREHLESVVRKQTVSVRSHRRAKIILLADEEKTNTDIAKQLDCDQNTVGTWRKRFAKEGIKGLKDRPRSGRPPKFTPEQETLGPPKSNPDASREWTSSHPLGHKPVSPSGRGSGHF